MTHLRIEMLLQPPRLSVASPLGGLFKWVVYDNCELHNADAWFLASVGVLTFIDRELHALALAGRELYLILPIINLWPCMKSSSLTSEY